MNSFVLSCIKLLNFFESIVIYTNDNGKRFIEEHLSSFKIVIIVLPEIQGMPELEKLYICSIQTEPFLFVDNDVYINKPLSRLILEKDVFVQWCSKDSNYLNSSLKDFKSLYFDINERPASIYNTGIIGGINNSFFKEFYSYVKNSIINLNLNYANHVQLKFLISSHLLNLYTCNNMINISCYYSFPITYQYTFDLDKMIDEYSFCQLPDKLKPFVEISNVLFFLIKKKKLLHNFTKLNVISEHLVKFHYNFDQKTNRIRKTLYNYTGNTSFTDLTKSVDQLLKQSISNDNQSLLIDFYNYHQEKIKYEMMVSELHMSSLQERFHTQVNSIFNSNSKLKLSKYIAIIESNWDWMTPNHPEEFMYLKLMYNKYKQSEDFVFIYYYRSDIENFFEEKLDTLGIIIASILQESITLDELLDKSFSYLRESSFCEDFKTFLEKTVLQYLQRWAQAGLIYCT